MIDEIKSRPHYEVPFGTEEEARNEEYLLFDWLLTVGRNVTKI